MMVFQEFEQLMPWKTVYQNVLFPMKVTHKFARTEAAARAQAAIEKVNSPASATSIRTCCPAA